MIDSLPHVREFASALYESRYADFFRAFAGLLESLRTDCFLHAHSRYFQREVRVKVYSQVCLLGRGGGRRRGPIPDDILQKPPRGHAAPVSCHPSPPLASLRHSFWSRTSR